MRYRKITIQYIIVLSVHLAYIFEQIWGYSIFVNALGGIGKFLALNWVLLVIPLVVLNFVSQKRIWAFQAGSVYAIAMILVGLVHTTGYLVTHRYFYGFAGLVSSIGLIFANIPLLIALRREIPALSQ